MSFKEAAVSSGGQRVASQPKGGDSVYVEILGYLQQVHDRAALWDQADPVLIIFFYLNG